MQIEVFRDAATASAAKAFPPVRIIDQPGQSSRKLIFIRGSY
jgi:hypothetical protein